MSVKSITAAAAFALATIAPAHAAVITTNTGTNSGTVTVTPSGDDATIVFDWEFPVGDSVTAFAEFNSDKPFDLFLTDLVSNGDNDDVTGVTLDILDALGNTVMRLTNDTDFCEDAAGDVSGNCDLFALPTSTDGNAATAANPSTITALVADLAAGNYRLGIYDSGSPNDATATFQVSAVPIPAALPLFASVIGAGGFLRSRRRRNG